MENLNAEQIKKALECCTRSGKHCTECVYFHRAVDDICAPYMIEDAIALITSQEQEIERLEKLCALRDRDCKDTQDLLYKAEAKNAELEKKYALAVAEREANVKGFSETLAVIHDDTVRKMQERLTKEFDRMHKNNFMTPEVRQWIIDQIAKEMIGEGR